MTKIQSKLAWKKEILGDANTEWKDLEKILLAIVGGTLAASITFFSTKEVTYIHKGLLVKSWSLLCFSLISLLASYIFSERFSVLLLQDIKNSPKPDLTEEEVELLKSKRWIWWIEKSNLAAVIFAAIGIIFFVAFGSLNV